MSKVIWPNLSKIIEILPKLPTDQNFWECTCTLDPPQLIMHALSLLVVAQFLCHCIAINYHRSKLWCFRKIHSTLEQSRS